MSIVALADGGKSAITLDTLRDVAAKNKFKIAKADEEAYLLGLQSAEATTNIVDQLPEYIDPRLAPVPTVGGERKFYKATRNSQNAWSHRAELSAEAPVSNLLKGRTIAMKDNMSVAGLPYTCGTFLEILSHEGKTYPKPRIDATVVKRVLEAGGTITGTSTCENYSLTPMSYTSANGPVHNPWLRNHNAGGSTSGGACLLALRQARAAGVPGLEDAGDDIDIAMGGDQAGSIRLPAAYCGVYGLKPTHGLIPYTGIAGLHPMIDYTGPLAHNLDDIATMLTVLAGYDGLDPRMTPESPLRENVKDYRAELDKFTASKNPGKGLRVGIITESLSSPGTDPTLAEVVKAAAFKHFAAAGATVEEVSVPIHLVAPQIWAASCRTFMSQLAIATHPPSILSHPLPHFTPRWPPDQSLYDILTHTNPAVINILLCGTYLAESFAPAVQAKAHAHVLEMRAAYDAAMRRKDSGAGGYDVLITPTTPTVAPHHPDMRRESEGGSSVKDKFMMAVGATNNTCPFNSSGHPALSVPCGWARAEGGTGGWLPVGMQIVGRRWDESGVLNAARVFEVGGGGLGAWPGEV